MKKHAHRCLSVLLALAMCLSLMAGITLTASADTVEYRYGSTSQYSNCSNVIYNWGSRGAVATFLSPNAEAFYEDNNTSYSALSALSGSSTTSGIPSSALFQTLRTLMTENHSYVNSYDASRDMFAFTDCQNSALTSTKISSFYSGSQIGPAWDSGSTWNREHTWPNSKGDANGNGENDIMMLRPASSSENSGRNNTAYGESSSYYNPNSASGGTYDLRGDVARIVLYVYVRWQDTTDSRAVLFGTDGVIESKEVMLKWMEEDPVDTWEMGRNDSVESITGTRNVFVDYPELAFLLFGSSVPANYQSPSNNSGDSGNTENVEVCFVENGKQTRSYIVPAGQSIEMPAASVSPDTGYSFAGWVTDTVEETADKPANIYAVGANYTAAEQTFYALYTRVDFSTGSGNIYKLYTGDITEGDYVITYTDSTGTGAMEATISNNRFTYQLVTVNDNIISNPDSGIVWHIAADGEYYTIQNDAGYAAAHFTSGQAILLGWLTDYGRWTVSGTETFNFVNLANSRYLRKNSTYGFSCYASSTGGPLTLYKATTGTTYYSSAFGDNCAHADRNTATVNATCTENGSVIVSCSSCGEVLSTTVITATGHSYINGICTGCGIVDPDASEAPVGSYVKVTSALEDWTGTYLIVYEDGTKAYVFNGKDAVNGYVSATISDNTIGSDDAVDAVAVTVKSMSNGYAIKTADGYIYGTSGSNKLSFNSAEQSNTITFNTDGTVHIVSNTSVLRFNSASNQLRFRYFKSETYSNQKAIYLYKLVEAQAEPVASVNGVEYTTFEAAYAACGEGRYVKLLDDIDLDALEMTKDLYIDLNGHTMEALVENSQYTVYGMDTATDQYASSGGYLCLLDQSGNVVTPQIHVQADSKRYMAIENENGWSFHRYYIGITTISLSTATTGIGYKAQFFGTPEVVAQLADTQAFGYTLRLEGGNTVARYLDSVTSGQTVSLRVSNFDVANYSETALYAKVSINLGGTVIESAEHSITLKQLVETVNENYTNYTAQLDALAAFVEKYYDTMQTWQVENLYKPQ